MVWCAFHSVSWSTQSKAVSVVDETEIDVFLKLSCFLYNSANVGNLISSSFSFFKPSLAIWKFLVRRMLKPSMQDFKHDLSSLGDEYNWWLAHSLVLSFLGIGMRTDLSLVATAGPFRFADIMNAKFWWHLPWGTLKTFQSLFSIICSSRIELSCFSKAG